MSDDPILAALSRLETGLTRLEAGQTRLEAGQTRLEAGQTQLEAGLTQLEARQTQLEARQTQLEARQTQLEARQTQLEAGQKRLEAGHIQLRTDMMARMDRLEDTLTMVRDDIAVNFGANDAMKRVNENTRAEVRALGEMVTVMQRQIQRLQTAVREIRGDS